MASAEPSTSLGVESEKDKPSSSKVKQNKGIGPTDTQRDKLAQSAVSRIGGFLLRKCAKKNRNDGNGLQDEYFLADELKKPDDETRSLLSKFDKQIKARVADLGAPVPKVIVFIGYKTHQVSGKDFFLKIKAANSGQYFHLRIYESLQQEFILQDVAGPKLNSDKIEIS